MTAPGRRTRACSPASCLQAPAHPGAARAVRPGGNLRPGRGGACPFRERARDGRGRTSREASIAAATRAVRYASRVSDDPGSSGRPHRPRDPQLRPPRAVRPRPRGDDGEGCTRVQVAIHDVCDPSRRLSRFGVHQIVRRAGARQSVSQGERYWSGIRSAGRAFNEPAWAIAGRIEIRCDRKTGLDPADAAQVERPTGTTPLTRGAWFERPTGQARPENDACRASIRNGAECATNAPSSSITECSSSSRPR